MIEGRYLLAENLSPVLQNLLDESEDNRHFFNKTDFFTYAAKGGEFLASIVVSESDVTMSMAGPQRTAFYTDNPQLMVSFKDFSGTIAGSYNERVDATKNLLLLLREKNLLNDNITSRESAFKTLKI